MLMPCINSPLHGFLPSARMAVAHLSSQLMAFIASIRRHPRNRSQARFSRPDAAILSPNVRHPPVFIRGCFQKPLLFRKRGLHHSGHPPEGWVRHRAETSSQSCRNFSSRHLHHCEGQPRRSHGCASIRVPRLSLKTLLGGVADRAAQESIGGAHIGAPPSRISIQRSSFMRSCS
jgi:hypothetical protein